MTKMKRAFSCHCEARRCRDRFLNLSEGADRPEGLSLQIVKKLEVIPLSPPLVKGDLGGFEIAELVPSVSEESRSSQRHCIFQPSPSPGGRELEGGGQFEIWELGFV